MLGKSRSAIIETANLREPRLSGGGNLIRETASSPLIASCALLAKRSPWFLFGATEGKKQIGLSRLETKPWSDVANTRCRRSVRGLPVVERLPYLAGSLSEIDLPTPPGVEFLDGLWGGLTNADRLTKHRGPDPLDSDPAIGVHDTRQISQ